MNKVIFLSGWGLLSLFTVRRRRFDAEKERAQGKFIKAGQEGHCAGRGGRAFFFTVRPVTSKDEGQSWEIRVQRESVDRAHTTWLHSLG